MFEIQGKYATAKVFAGILEKTAVDQIKTLLNQPFMEDTQPRFMPDAHAGKGCVIGTTMHIRDEICPNLVGVDIACGVLVVELGKAAMNPIKLDQIIHLHIPAGFNTHKTKHSTKEIKQRFGFAIEDLKIYDKLPVQVKERAKKSYGTLGGGNHFIELAKSDESDRYYLVIHSGSRHLGHQIAQHYQSLAEKKWRRSYHKGRSSDLATLHRSDDQTEFGNYLHDSEIARKYAKVNRILMAENILNHYFDSQFELQLDGRILKDGLQAECSWFETVHNYIDQSNRQDMILRKGAISAQTGERVILPLNMRDGSVIAIGKGNPDWNYSGPHGAGRSMSRSQARRQLNLEDFKQTMAGIYTTTATRDTIDEAPFAYKDSQEIIDQISDTLTIVDHIRPIYNFKAK